MMKRTDRGIASLVTAALSLGFVVDARAELMDRGTYDGVRLIYDSTQHLTWLGDANWAKTSGFDADGEMTWDEASAWARGLTIGGFSDWRLPLTFDETCRGAGCTNSETGHLFTVEGVSSASSGPFRNVEEHQYWSRRSYSSNRNLAWYIHFGNGHQTVAGKTDGHIPWAVRAGDVGGEVSIETKPGSFPTRVNPSLRVSTWMAVLGPVLLNINDIGIRTLILGMAGLETVKKTDRALYGLRVVSVNFTAVPEVGPDGRQPRLGYLSTLGALFAGQAISGRVRGVPFIG